MATATIQQLGATGTPALTDYIEVAQGSSASTKSQMSMYAPLIIATISNTVTGITYTDGVFSLTAGYIIPTTASLATCFKQGGNSFAATAVIGTTDNNDFSLMANNVIGITLKAAGTVIVQSLGGSGAQMVVVDNFGTLGVQTIPVASGIQSLNGLTGGTQTFATPGTAGTAPNWVSSGTAHTLNIPIASSANTGLVSTGAQVIAGVKTFNSTANIPSITIEGSGGNGWINYIAQSSVAPTPGSGITIYSDASHRFVFNSIAGFTATFDSTGFSAGRVYTLPDATMTLVGGTGVNTRLAFWGTANTISSDSGLTYTSSILSLNTIGGTIAIKTGSNGKVGTGTLVAGTLTIANTSITANSKIFVTINTLGTVGAPKALVVTKIAATGFTVTSSDNTDTSIFDFVIIEQIP